MSNFSADKDVAKLLKGVSRSFYLTLRMLPGPIRPQISVAYLLARTSDTIADTKLVARQQRVQLLQEFRAGKWQDLPKFLLPHHKDDDEKQLLERVGDCFKWLESFSADDQTRIRELLDTITRGQEGDLQRFTGEKLSALETDAELEEYTYAVAGCVGKFWTEMCVAHLPELAHWDVKKMTELGTSFGKGLQLINILRDFPEDIRQKRCYLPRQRIEKCDILLDGLKFPSSFAHIRKLYFEYVYKADEWLADGWHYAMQIPKSQWRLRLACIWPILIGLATLQKLRKTDNVLAAPRVKISRFTVYEIMARSFLAVKSDRSLETLRNQWRH
jgi:farnesyl-diphosphate farnesyltransferase